MKVSATFFFNFQHFECLWFWRVTANTGWHNRNERYENTTNDVNVQHQNKRV